MEFLEDFDNMLDSIAIVSKVLDSDELNDIYKLDEISFMSFLCTVIDTYTVKNNKDSKEIITIMKDVVVDVNDTFGKMKV
jgi:phage-related tail protein